MFGLKSLAGEDKFESLVELIIGKSDFKGIFDNLNAEYEKYRI